MGLRSVSSRPVNRVARAAKADQTGGLNVIRMVREVTLDRVALAFVRPILVVVSVLAIGSAALNGAADAAVPLIDLAVLAPCAVVWWLLDARNVPGWWARLVGTVFGLALAGTTLVRYRATGDSICALHLVIELGAFGAVSLSRRWLQGSTLAIVGGWLAVSVGELELRGYIEAAAGVVGAAVLANLVFEARYHALASGDRAVRAGEDALSRAQGELRDQLLRSQRLESVTLVAAGLAHDMNNSLQCIRTFAEGLRNDLPETSPHLGDVAMIVDEAGAAASLTRRLLTFDREREPFIEIDLRVVLANTTALLARVFPQHAIDARIEHGAARIHGDPVELNHALVNLCINASDAMPHGGTIAVETHLEVLDQVVAAQLDTGPGSYIVVRVTDSGTGMDAETQERVFEPFFTTKPVGRGAGLGLATVARTMKRHRGAIALDSAPGSGTTVSLYLPVI